MDPGKLLPLQSSRNGSYFNDGEAKNKHKNKAKGEKKQGDTGVLGQREAGTKKENTEDWG